MVGLLHRGALSRAANRLSASADDSPRWIVHSRMPAVHGDGSCAKFNRRFAGVVELLHEQHRAWLALAVKAAERGAVAVEESMQESRFVCLDSRRDVKILADGRAETAIVNCLKVDSAFPVLTEESGSIAGPDMTSGYRWIVDPLDGSLNFSRGIPLCCISVALWKGNDPILGVVNDINHKEVFSAVVGEGAWLNDVPIRTSLVAETNAAILCTGFPVSTDFSESGITDFLSHVIEFKKVRLLGSAALSLAYVASGRADAYTERDIRIWDVAGGIALVKAAGGKVEVTPTEHEQRVVVKAANGRLKF